MVDGGTHSTGSRHGEARSPQDGYGRSETWQLRDKQQDAGYEDDLNQPVAHGGGRLYSRYWLTLRQSGCQYETPGRSDIHFGNGPGPARLLKSPETASDRGYPPFQSTLVNQSPFKMPRPRTAARTRRDATTLPARGTDRNECTRWEAFPGPGPERPRSPEALRLHLSRMRSPILQSSNGKAEDQVTGPSPVSCCRSRYALLLTASTMASNA
jgi:hypothetical protein